MLQFTQILDRCPLLLSKENSLSHTEQMKLSPRLLASSGIRFLIPHGEHSKHLFLLWRFLFFPSSMIVEGILFPHLQFFINFGSATQIRTEILGFGDQDVCHLHHRTKQWIVAPL